MIETRVDSMPGPEGNWTDGRLMWINDVSGRWNLQRLGLRHPWYLAENTNEELPGEHYTSHIKARIAQQDKSAIGLESKMV